jgi:hypothetical protein
MAAHRLAAIKPKNRKFERQFDIAGSRLIAPRTSPDRWRIDPENSHFFIGKTLIPSRLFGAKRNLAHDGQVPP